MTDQDEHTEEGVIHVYDGIGELDNQLPRWWVLLFYATIIFAPIYMIYFHMMGQPGQEEKYAQAVAAHDKMVAEQQPAPGWREQVRRGKHRRCRSRKGPDAVYHPLCRLPPAGWRGLVGPNLCDEYWLNGPSFEDNMKTIIDGVPERGMISWKAMLKPDDIYAVASHVYNLRGNTPATAKAPEGKKYGSDGAVVDEKPRAALGVPPPAAEPTKPDSEPEPASDPTPDSEPAPQPAEPGKETTNTMASSDAAVLAHGKTLFTTHCVACHLPDGGGLVGPNLCDDYWLNGPSFEENLNTIINGVPERGMIAWKLMLKPDDIHAVASYVYGLRGSTPATAKVPEGKKYGEDGAVLDEKPRVIPGAPPPAATPEPAK